MFDYLIVGAGFAGSVLAERLATQRNATVVVIDKRNHVGGNAYDFYDDAGLLRTFNEKYLIFYVSIFISSCCHTSYSN